MTASLRQAGSEGTVGGAVTLVHPENIHIGARSYINGGYIAASPHARIIIGSDCMISYDVHVRTDMHRHDLTSGIPMNQQGETEKDIVIGDNVWIGYGAQIMSGVSIGSNSVIAAGAVVTKEVPANQVWGGIPAKKLK